MQSQRLGVKEKDACHEYGVLAPRRYQILGMYRKLWHNFIYRL